MGQEAVAGARVHQEVLGRNGVPQEDEVTARELSRKWPRAALECQPGTGGGGSGGRRCQTARDNNKHTAVAPQPPVERVDQGKSGPGENGGRWSEAAMRQENHHWSEVAAHEKRSRLTGAAWKAVAAAAPP